MNRLDSACSHCAPHRGKPIWATQVPFATRRGAYRSSVREAQRLVSRQGILDSYRSSLKERPQGQAGYPLWLTVRRFYSGEDRLSTDMRRQLQAQLQQKTSPALRTAEFDKIVEESNQDTLLVVDFYRTACGSCRYIQGGFKKLCKGSLEDHAPVEFYKHNIIDEYDEETDLAERLKIKAVPLFQFYKGGKLLEEFATREKKRIGSAINRHCGQEVIHSAALHD